MYPSCCVVSKKMNIFFLTCLLFRHLHEKNISCQNFQNLALTAQPNQCTHQYRKLLKINTKNGSPFAKKNCSEHNITDATTITYLSNV